MLTIEEKFSTKLFDNYYIVLDGPKLVAFFPSRIDAEEYIEFKNKKG